MDDLSRAVDPHDYGAVLWGGLHTLAGEEFFNSVAWEAFVEYMRAVLDPVQSPATGCAECSEHFELHCLVRDPAAVLTQEAAAHWGWEIHDEVRRRQGRPRLSYVEAAERWAW
jgi:hypothetical protein